MNDTTKTERYTAEWYEEQRRIGAIVRGDNTESARLAAVRADHWTGSKYVEGRDIKAIAKDIRRDIAAAIQAEALPTGIKCSVRVQRYSGGQSLYIDVTAVPNWLGIASPEFVRWLDGPSSGTRPDRLTRAASTVLKTVEAIGNAYNYDKSDIQTDYHDCKFFLHVSFRDLESTSRESIRREIAGGK